MNPTPEEFRAYINRIDDFVLEALIEEILPTLELLEQDDFFGTEGWEKRFA